jgi:GWxTD domain-containing protein
MRKTALSILVVLVAVAASAAGSLSKKYKTWDRSPEAYFLTNSEKSQWKQVRTDADAQSFILDYKAKRGPEFEKMLADREAVADKYFSSGETKGSETLRGKVVIVLGPPASIEREPKTPTKQNADISRVNSVDAKGEGSALSNSGAPSPMGPHSTGAQTPVFIFVYDQETAPKAIGKPFRAELKMYSDTDQEAADPKNLDAKFEAVAEASVATVEAAGSKHP